MKRIGLIGGLSWESTASYYALLNQLTAQCEGPWQQPLVTIDSVNFGDIVRLQTEGDWEGSGRVLADSARRLEAAGASVLGICANTMHMNVGEVAAAVAIPVLDIRDAILRELRASGAESMALLGTKYLMDNDFYSSYLERHGVHVVKPTAQEIDELQSMIFSELTQGIVTDHARERFIAIADGCASRGAQAIGLCCTEFGLVVDAESAPWPVVDSTLAHVKALLDS